MKFYHPIFNAIFTFFIFTDKATAQEEHSAGSTYRYNVGITGLKGFVVPQHKVVRHLTYGRPTGIEVFFNRPALGEKEREHIYGMPQTGFSFTYINTDMEETGSICNADAYMDLFFLKTKYLKPFLRLGAGLTFASRIYDRETNNLNNVLSLPVSYHALIKLGFEVPVAEKWYIQPAITWSHTSNGSLNLPNNGINVASMNIGTGYRFKKARKVARENSEPATVEKGVRFNFLFSATAKESEPLGSPQRLYYTLQASADKTINKISRLYVGVELFNNTGLIDVIEKEPDVDDDTDFRRVGMFFGYELMVSERLSFLSMLGHYVYRPFRGVIDKDPDMYHRHGFKVYVMPRMFLTAMMKVHRAEADVFDFGVGLRL